MMQSLFQRSSSLIMPMAFKSIRPSSLFHVQPSQMTLVGRNPLMRSFSSAATTVNIEASKQ